MRPPTTSAALCLILLALAPLTGCPDNNDSPDASPDVAQDAIFDLPKDDAAPYQTGDTPQDDATDETSDADAQQDQQPDTPPPALCLSNERVSSMACVSCEPGTTNEAGDSPAGPDTICDDACSGIFGAICANIEQMYIKGSMNNQRRVFGVAVALSGDTVVAGALQEASAFGGLNPDQNDRSTPGSGAAYVFTRANGTWSQQAYIKASNTGKGDAFGSSVLIQGDRLAVGARSESGGGRGFGAAQGSDDRSRSGAVYMFTRQGNTWAQEVYLKMFNDADVDDLFGAAVAFDGDTLVSGAPFEASNSEGIGSDPNNNDTYESGAVYVYSPKR